MRAAYIQSFQLPPPPPKEHLLFVYGTLKAGFHWNEKFLWRASLRCRATTRLPFPLVVGECGVPYLLGDRPSQGYPIRGEVYEVDAELLEGMDDYEGVSKGYYERRQIEVLLDPVSPDPSPETLTAWVYLLPRSDAQLHALPHIPEYTREIHDVHYLPIRHIQVKQQRYLGLLDDYHTRS